MLKAATAAGALSGVATAIGRGVRVWFHGGCGLDPRRRVSLALVEPAVCLFVQPMRQRLLRFRATEGDAVLVRCLFLVRARLSLAELAEIEDIPGHAISVLLAERIERDDRCTGLAVFGLRRFAIFVMGDRGSGIGCDLGRFGVFILGHGHVELQLEIH